MGYENLIVNELIPYAKQKTGHEKTSVAGCSFGGYNALNLTFRHPRNISYCLSMSGAFDIKQFLDGYYDDNCYFNNPPDYIANINDEYILEQLKQIGIVLGVGEIDACKDERTLPVFT